MTKPEDKLSTDFKAACKAIGPALKATRIEARNTALGIPDWFLLFQGKIILVELKVIKTKGAKINYTPAQELFLGDAAEQRAPVYVLAKNLQDKSYYRVDFLTNMRYCISDSLENAVKQILVT